MGGLAVATPLARASRRHLRFRRRAGAIMTPFFLPDSGGLAVLRDLAFHRMRLLPRMRREMPRKPAGPKTGPAMHATPQRLSGPGATPPPAAGPAPGRG